MQLYSNDTTSVMNKMQVEMDRLREENVQAHVQAAKAETERVRREMTPKAAISDEQLVALQIRLEQLHEAKLLTDEACFVVEDMVADFAELRATLGVVTMEMLLTPGSAFELAAKLHKLISVSEAITNDSAFARQARRKFMS
eukprot:COSAG02_NODE_10106_length_2021_cov_1.970343_2_plen_142_part_00